MARTFIQLQDEVLHDEFDQSKYRDLVKRWLNEGAQELVARVRLPAQQQKVALTINAASVTLPANVRVIESITLDDDGAALTEEDWRALEEYPTSTGRPRVFSIYGSTLEFWPAPATSYAATIRAYVALTEMTDGGALSVPEEAEDALIHYARSRAFAMEDDFEGAQFEQGLWEQAIAQLRHAVQTRSRGRVRQTPGMLQYAPTPRFLRP